MNCTDYNVTYSGGSDVRARGAVRRGAVGVCGARAAPLSGRRAHLPAPRAARPRLPRQARRVRETAAGNISHN